ncbi:inversin [Bombina bombina]|uniref:inversin n=1 Tax=Bombina bombina TaxID=8345 RepID=UPI00235A7C29|nr:inversin [Bombina bombina]
MMSCVAQGSSLASPVHAAAVTGDKATLMRLIGSNPSLLDQEDQLGRTPLMYSVLGDRRACAETLLRAGAQVNHSDRSGRTALHLAAQTGNHRLLKLLLSRRADCTHRDMRDITALHLSTRHQDTRCLALLLKHTPPGQVDAQDQRKQTALHWSAYYNRPRHVKLLVRHDSNIGIPDLEGKIPLHWAAGHKDPEAVLTVRCLLEAAPTESLLNWQDYEGRTPLHLAVGDGNQDVVRLLTSYRGCNVAPYDNLFRTPLHWAALLGHTPIAHILLEGNHSPNIPSDSQGATPLHYAAQGNCPDTVRVLLAHPSVRDEADLEGRTAFMWAAGKGSDEAVRAMLELDSELELNRTDKYGGTALHAASLSGQISTVRILLENGAHVDAADVMKHTPLFRACEMGHREVIHTLIKGGAKVHLVDKDGRSPLHWAALGGNANVCQILIENNINPNAQDYEGRTPLQCAAYGGYIGCMEVLMENKADPNIQDKNGRTALHWSCNNGYLDAVKLLLHYNAFPNQMENTEERYTPLDYALLGGHQEVTQFMLEHGALSIAAIQDIAASKIQAVYKGHKVRTAFRDRKNLLMKHEQLRKDAAAKKREGENKRKTRVDHVDEKQKENLEHEKMLSDVQQNKSPDERKTKRSSNDDCEKEVTKKENEREIELEIHISNDQPLQVKHTSPRQRDAYSAPIRISSRTSYTQTSLSLNEKLEVLPLKNSPRQKSQRSSKHKKESSEVVMNTNDNARHKKGVKLKKEGTEIAVDPSLKDTEASEDVIHRGKEHMQPVIKSNRISRKGTSDIAIQKESHSILEAKAESPPRKEKEGLKIVTHKLQDVQSSHRIKSRESSERHRDRKSSSAKVAPYSPNDKETSNEEDRTFKPHRSTSVLKSSHSNRIKPITDCKGADFSTTSDLDFRRTLTVPLPSGSVKGQSHTKWQQLDIELIPLEARLQLVEREKFRKQLFQRKNQAAIIIQRAWRTYCRRQYPV